jgi:hypothetical protein
LPVLGGTITPPGRVDTIAGAAVRVPFGELRLAGLENQPLRDAQPGGVAPLVAVRTRLVADLDIGLKLSPSIVELEGRYGFKLGETTSLIGVIAPYGGWIFPNKEEGVHVGDRLGTRLGVQSPWLVVLSIEGIYQAWGGARISAEHAWGTVQLEDRHGKVLANVIRTGAFVGFGLGFRRFWALVELAGDYEWWKVERAKARSSPSGISLTPAFALQLRL